MLEMKPTLFIGSSSERRDVALSLELNLKDDAEINVWTLSFTPGQSAYHELLEHSRRYDFAVLVMTPDDVIISRDSAKPATRDNVIFELGLFLGSIGADRVFAVCDATRRPSIFSDYLGVTYLTYASDRSDKDLSKALSPTATQVRSAIHRLGKINKASQLKSYLFPGELIGLDKIYDSFDDARPYIFADLKNTLGPIRIFIHIASQDVGIKGSFFDVLDEIVKKGTVDTRVLHAAHDSPLFAKSRLLLMGKDYSRVIKSLDYAASSLQSLESMSSSGLRRRSHDLPFIWRLYFVLDRMYFMPYFSEKDAVKTSPVLVFSRTEKSLYHIFKEWFDYVWEKSSLERVELSDIVSPAAPAGAALFLLWKRKHVFGIPMRDLRRAPTGLRFYGIGGKRLSSNETFEACALREGNEELSGAVAGLQDAAVTSYVRSDGTTRTVSVSNSKTIPRLIFEKVDHSGFGVMSINADGYFLVAFDGVLSKAPQPSREIAAVLLLTDDCLRLFLNSRMVTLAQLQASGGEIIEQTGVTLPSETILMPHGTALFTVRSLA